MKILRFALLFFACLFGFNVNAQEYIARDLEFTCELKVTIYPIINLGETPHGKRVIIPISGGTFEDPKLKGTVLKGGVLTSNF